MIRARPAAGPGRAARAQRGGIAVMAALLLPLLVGVGALVIDLGRMIVYRTELQNAMDACALAAVAPLTGANDPNVFDVGRAHGLALADPTRAGVGARSLVSVNRLHFQRDTLDLRDTRVEFSSAASGQPWVEASASQTGGLSPQVARFARCSHRDSAQDFYFAPVLRLLSPTVPTALAVSATATATLARAQSACAIPVAVCVQPGGTAANLYGRTIGERMVAVNNPSSGYGSGNFGWLDFTPPAGGASELRGLVNNSGSCSVQVGQAVGQPGVISSLESAWNSRFGIYASGTQPQTAPPDFTGYAYSSGSNHYADFVTRTGARAAFQGNVGGGTTKLSSAQHAALGQQRRVATAAMVDCSVWAASGSAQPPVLDFACVLLLAPVRNGGSAASWTEVSATMDLEFLGLTRNPGTPCATGGLAGGAYGPPVPTLVQ